MESQLSAESPEVDLTTESPAMQTVLEMAFQGGKTATRPFYLGESGTGKSVLAKGMHARSPRKGRAFVTVSCPSLSRELLESELFAMSKERLPVLLRRPRESCRRGRGTLLLDEIGDLPLESNRSCCACCRRGNTNGR